ncbi:MAG: aminoglycoside phosphotransferase family protein [Propionibacteriaceae bacterium]
MMIDTIDSYVDYIDNTTWQQLVGALLHSENAEIISRHTEEIFIGVGAGTRLYRVTGTITGRRRPVHWTIIIKVLTLDQLSFQSISTDQSSWDYWKREWHAYQSPWQQQLAGPLVAPRCVATGELLAETDEELAWIAMEDLEAMDHRPWPHGRFRKVARQLGIFNGEYLAGRPLPTDPWLSRDWLRGWTEAAEPVMDILPTVSGHPVAGKIFTKDLIKDLIELWEQREKLYQALDQLPQTFCHNDVFPRNLFLGDDGHPDRSVAIDWAFCGSAPVGQELTALVGASQAFLESRPERWDDLERDCLDGYAEGLQQAGWHGSDEIRLGYLVSSVLRFSLGALPPLLGLTLTTGHEDLVVRVFGCSYDEFVGNAAAFMQFKQRRIRQTKALLGL